MQFVDKNSHRYRYFVFSQKNCTFVPMNYRDIISRLSSRYESGEAKAVARLLLEKQCGLSWTDALCGGVEALSEETTASLESSVQRLEQGEPVQYVLGEADFYGRTFHVEPGVLIPRIETEELIDAVVDADIPEGRVLDIGTGSGCIAVTLALELAQNSHVTDAVHSVEAWDISDEALRIARGNAEKLGARVDFVKQDVLSSVLTIPDGGFAAIVSNPPYICNKERVEMESHVLDYEPDLALFVPDDDPLLFYRAITRYAVQALSPGGMLFFEINRAYGEETAQLLKDHGFVGVSLLKDQFGNHRIVKGQKF